MRAIELAASDVQLAAAGEGLFGNASVDQRDGGERLDGGAGAHAYRLDVVGFDDVAGGDVDDDDGGGD
jgi:hypothetical protein